MRPAAALHVRRRATPPHGRRRAPGNSHHRTHCHRRHPPHTAGTPLQLLYVDTEGFESTGRSNSYDDRVFAVATVLSSLLVYNLPETIRGSDVSKLSFVVELAAGLYDAASQVSRRPVGSRVRLVAVSCAAVARRLHAHTPARVSKPLSAVEPAAGASCDGRALNAASCCLHACAG